MQEWIEKIGGIDNAAASLAPAIRALFKKDNTVLVSFTEKGVASDAADLTLVIKDCDSLDAVYTNLQKASAQGAKPCHVVVEGVGEFTLCEPESKRGTRLAGRISLVTGGAQGFGEGIARELATNGATLVIADLNLALAETVAASLNEKHGAGTAIALAVDVGNEESVQNLILQTVLRFGGLDLLVSNAGVLRAGGLEEMTLKAFEFVTHINYTAFFLMTKYSSRPMKIQARFDEAYTSDIVQINSKSGLEGSNKNFAYAGGKFGGIGLVQSFAKELVEHRIKVNAICPGNYYEGPLWSDPEKGLFVAVWVRSHERGADAFNFIYGQLQKTNA